MQPSPSITDITPAEVKAKETITLTGSGFGQSQGASVLSIGGVTADTILSWSDSEIQAVVPDSALTGTVKATVQDKDSDEKKLVVLWDNENPQNVVIPGNHASPLNAQIIAEGVGGSILVWNDFRGSTSVIYAQRLNSRGKIIWNSDGVALSSATGAQYFPQLVSDEHGGAIVVWQESRTGIASGYDIYAQRISPSGDILWRNAASVCTAANAQEKPKIVSDGSGGAVIAWQDNRSGNRFDIYAQRINGDGVPQWTADGVAVSTANNVYPYNLPSEIVADGAGGAIIVWPDKTTGTWRIKAQRVTTTGALAWSAEGVPVSATATTQYVSCPVADGSGGAILAWTSSGGDLYAQRIATDGTLQWTSDVLVSGAIGVQSGPKLTADGAGGAIMAWEDSRFSSANRDIYAQRINALGQVQWTADGVAVSTAASAQYGPQLVSDGRGGAIITWYDYRNYNLPNSGTIQGVDTFAQRLSADGLAQWPADGTAISAAALHQMYPKIASDNSGGAIIIWEDQRTGSAVDLYAQGISTGGKQ